MKTLSGLAIFFLLPLLGHAVIEPDIVKDNIISNSHAAIAAAQMEQEIMAKIPLLSRAAESIPTFIASAFSVLGAELAQADFLESAFFADLFNERQIVRHSSTELSYLLEPSLCYHVESALGRLVCTTVLDKYFALLNVTSLNNADYELNLEVKLKNSQQDFEQLISLSSYRNVTAKTINLDGWFRVHKKLMAVSEDLRTTLSTALAGLAGQISFSFQFTTDDQTSGCLNQARSCVYFNIDKEVSFLSDKSGLDLFTWNSSPQLKPTLSAYMHNNGQYEVNINNGPFAVQLNQPEFFLGMGRLTTSFVVHPSVGVIGRENDPLLTIKNFYLQKDLNNVELKHHIFELNGELLQGRTCQPVVISKNHQGLAATIGAFSCSIKTSSSDLNAPFLYEKLSFASSESSQFQFNWANDMSSESPPTQFRLEAVGNLKVLAHSLGKIVCEQGNLTMSYQNGCDDEAAGTTPLVDRTVEITSGQCLHRETL